MAAPEYALHPYSERFPGVATVSELNDLAFAQYPGVIEGGEAFMRWYMDRPGLDPDLCRGVWSGNSLVASLFVTVLPLYLHGALHQVGVIDTVMTHPHHRRRGLARLLLSSAMDRARGRGLDALQLYTMPGSPGHCLYTSLGFADRAVLRYWTAEATAGDPTGWRRAQPEEDAISRATVEAMRERYDGVPQLNEAYWAWRRRLRPPSIPAEVRLRFGDGSPDESVALLPTPMTALGKRVVLSDISVRREDSLVSLAAALPTGAALVALADEADAVLSSALRQAGFAPGAAEATMLLPLTESVAAAPTLHPWFALTESVIGV